MPTAPRPARAPRRRRRLLGHALTLALLVAWVVLLRPQALGGPAAYVVVSGVSMQPTMRDGDLVVIHSADAYRTGDVVAYRIPRGEPGAGTLVIHRIEGGSAARGFRVRGDNRATADHWRPRPRDVVGRAWVHVPGAGRVLALAGQPAGLAALTALLVFLRLGGVPVGEASSPGGRRLKADPGRADYSA